jgi:hypothetical protein
MLEGNMRESNKKPKNYVGICTVQKKVVFLQPQKQEMRK